MGEYGGGGGRFVLPRTVLRDSTSQVGGGGGSEGMWAELGAARWAEGSSEVLGASWELLAISMFSRESL